MAKRTTSVQWQILARQIPLLALLFVCVLYWLGENLTHRLISANLENARRSGQGVVYAVEASMLAASSHEVWDGVVDKVPLHPDTVIDIYNSGGTVVFSTNPSRRGATRPLTDAFCSRCHVGGSQQTVSETTFIRDPDDLDFQVFASPLRNTEDCQECHAGGPQKLGMVVVRQNLAPVQAQVRSVQVSLVLAGLIAFVLTMITTRGLLTRYLNRPLKRLVAGAAAIGTGNLEQPIELRVGNELGVLADALNSSRRNLGSAMHQLKRQRDDFRTLYRLVDQLSRGILPGERRQRAVELAGKILRADCLLVRIGCRLTDASGDGVVVFRKNGEVVEEPLSEQLGVAEYPCFYSPSLVSRWLAGELDQSEEVTDGDTIGYPLLRGGQRLGLLLRDATPEAKGSGAPRDEELVRELCKQISIALEYSNMQRELIEEERLAAIGETAAGLAHWLKNTLNGLRAGQYVIDKAVERGDLTKLEKGWDVMKKSINRVEKLTSDLLFCAKERVPERQPANPNLIIREVVENSRDRALRFGVELAMELDETLEDLPLDRDAVHRALLNLVTNAVDACYDSERGDLVTVRSRDTGEDLVIAVQDNGAGMPESVRQRLFQRFFSTKGAKGTGLGLMVVQKIVEEHGGALEIESEPGAGSVFAMRLPKRRQELT
jgi:signal transduction histidine kinase